LIDKLTYRELAVALGVKQATINVNVGRDKLLADNNKRIDINHPLNKAWIESQEGQGKTFDINRLFSGNKEKEVKETEPEPESKPTKKGKPTGKDELVNLEIQQKKATLKKTQKAIEIDELKIKKLQGELIPFEEAEFLMVYIVEEIRTQSIQTLESAANLYKDRFGLSQEEYTEIRKDLNESANSIIIESVKKLKDGLEGIQDKYKEVRTKGERK
jgi:hypothetical protein